MTNILDTVEPTAWTAEDENGIAEFVEHHFVKVTGGQFPFNNPIALYSRETLEPAIERLLAEHRKQVLLEAAERCTEMAIAGNPTEDETWSNATALDCAEELRRMAEGEK